MYVAVVQCLRPRSASSFLFPRIYCSLNAHVDFDTYQTLDFSDLTDADMALLQSRDLINPTLIASGGDSHYGTLAASTGSLKRRNQGKFLSSTPLLSVAVDANVDEGGSLLSPKPPSTQPSSTAAAG